MGFSLRGLCDRLFRRDEPPTYRFTGELPSVGEDQGRSDTAYTSHDHVSRSPEVDRQYRFTGELPSVPEPEKVEEPETGVSQERSSGFLGGLYNRLFRRDEPPTYRFTGELPSVPEPERPTVGPREYRFTGTLPGTPEPYYGPMYRTIRGVSGDGGKVGYLRWEKRLDYLEPVVDELISNPAGVHFGPLHEIITLLQSRIRRLRNSDNKRRAEALLEKLLVYRDEKMESAGVSYGDYIPAFGRRATVTKKLRHYANMSPATIARLNEESVTDLYRLMQYARTRSNDEEAYKRGGYLRDIERKLPGFMVLGDLRDETTAIKYQEGAKASGKRSLLIAALLGVSTMLTQSVPVKPPTIITDKVVIVEKPVQVVVEHTRLRQVKVPVQVPVEKEVPVFVEKTVQVPVEREVPIIVEKVVLPEEEPAVIVEEIREAPTIVTEKPVIIPSIESDVDDVLNLKDKVVDDVPGPRRRTRPRSGYRRGAHRGMGGLETEPRYRTVTHEAEPWETARDCVWEYWTRHGREHVSWSQFKQDFAEANPEVTDLNLIFEGIEYEIPVYDMN